MDEGFEETRRKHEAQFTIRTFCEVCGRPGACGSVSGWTTCHDHIDAVKPDFPLFHWKSGEALDGKHDPRDWRREITELDAALYMPPDPFTEPPGSS